MKIFISYNHQDSEAAKAIATHLREAGFEVIRDVDEMRTGEKIEDFIARAVGKTDIVLWLASLNSLKSGWVTHEFAYAQQLRAEGRFWALQVQEKLFELDLFGKIHPELSMQLEELRKERESRGNSNIPSVDLDPQIKRLQDAIHHLPERLQFLSERLTLDVSGSNFSTAMKKLVADLEKWRRGVNIGGRDSPSPESAMNYDELKIIINTKALSEVFETLEREFGSKVKDESSYNSIKRRSKNGADHESETREKLLILALDLKK